MRVFNNTRLVQFGFSESSFSISCNSNETYSLAEFLFLDFPTLASERIDKQYGIISSGTKPMYSLWDEDNKLYFGHSKYTLAYVLMNAISCECIINETDHHALHAAAVYNKKRCILLPGTSGSGKSTITAWLIMNGYSYLTDELVFLNKNRKLLPFTRPINVKVNHSHPSWLIKDDDEEKTITCSAGSMIPHRLLNSDFEIKQPEVTDIIFPKFEPNSKAGFVEISPAKSCLLLAQSLVNARSLKQHGMPDLATIAKRCRSYTLTYSHFKDLESIFLKEGACT